jgi:neutral ceramidase
MNNSNPFISGDNKGAAELAIEQWARGPGAAAGEMAQSFVAAFAQGSVGDTSPNILGAFCLDTGKVAPIATLTSWDAATGPMYGLKQGPARQCLLMKRCIVSIVVHKASVEELR